MERKKQAHNLLQRSLKVFVPRYSGEGGREAPLVGLCPGSHLYRGERGEGPHQASPAAVHMEGAKGVEDGRVASWGSKVHLVRPLLLSTRSNTSGACRFWQLPIYPDSTNQEVRHLRSRVRKQLLPAIRFLFNPKVDRALLQESHPPLAGGGKRGDTP